MNGFFIFILGLTLGSFLNVVIYRLNHGFSPLKGRSFCPKCKKKIRWYDNLPLISFILLKGRCRFCHSPISWQYPLVELTTGLVFLVVYFIWNLSGGNLVFLFYQLLISSFLVAIFVSDLRYLTIPDELIWPAVFLSLFFNWFNRSFLLFLVSGLGAAGIFLFLALITKGRGMGGGDVKLVFLMGLVLGWSGILISLYWAFLTGAMTGVILILLGKKHFGQHIPFGPFLASGALLALLWGDKIWQTVKTALLW